MKGYEDRKVTDLVTLQRVAQCIITQLQAASNDKEKRTIIEKLLAHTDVQFVYALDIAYEMSPKPKQQDHELDKIVSGTPTLESENQ